MLRSQELVREYAPDREREVESERRTEAPSSRSSRLPRRCSRTQKSAPTAARMSAMRVLVLWGMVAAVKSACSADVME